MNQDEFNDGRLFVSQDLESSQIPSGYYIRKTLVNEQNSQMVSGGTNQIIYPTGIHVANEPVYDRDPIFMKSIDQYAAGKYKESV